MRDVLAGGGAGRVTLLTLTEAGRRMGRSRWTVRAYIDRGVLPFAVEVGRGRFAVPSAALERWLATGEGREAPLTLGTTGRVSRRST